MTKVELIKKVAADAGITQVKAEKVVDAVFDNIIDAVNNGDKVKIAGFGIFDKKVRAARVGFNPRTKEKIQVKASADVSFKSAKAFKDILN